MVSQIRCSTICCLPEGKY